MRRKKIKEEYNHGLREKRNSNAFNTHTESEYMGWTMEIVFGSAFFIIPGIGSSLVAGPLVSWIIGALEGAVALVELSAVGAVDNKGIF